MSKSGCRLLNLPSEIRAQIIDLVISELRLAPFPYFDPEWDQTQSVAAKPYQRAIPDIVFTCHQLYTECTCMLYTRATLEIAPPQQTDNFLFVHSQQGTVSDSYVRLTHTFRIYNPTHLKLIRRAHIFSNHSTVINGECYESTLKWLAAHTSVDTVELSQRIMTRIRGTVTFDLDQWRSAFSRDRINRLRVVRIWTKSNRRPWEYEKIQRLIARAGDGSLKPVQLYFLVCDRGTGVLQLDPRWLVTHHDAASTVHGAAIAATEIDQLMHEMLTGQELKDFEDGSRHIQNQSWIYQILVISPYAYGSAITA